MPALNHTLQSFAHMLTGAGAGVIAVLIISASLRVIRHYSNSTKHLKRSK